MRNVLLIFAAIFATLIGTRGSRRRAVTAAAVCALMILGPTMALAVQHGDNPSQGGESANPNGQGVNGGNGIHNIRGGAPGQNGGDTRPGGELPACTMHGGMAGTNPNCVAEHSH